MGFRGLTGGGMLPDRPGGNGRPSPPITDLDRRIVRVALDAHRAREARDTEKAEGLEAELARLHERKRAEEREFYRRLNRKK